MSFMDKFIKKIKVIAVKCPECGDLIYSRARYDFRYCSCGEIAIDGGFDYVKISYKKISPEKYIKYIIATKQELYDDWNKNINKYGIIKI